MGHDSERDGHDRTTRPPRREREEIAARVASFKATQEKFKREREEYFFTTLENARHGESSRHAHGTSAVLVLRRIAGRCRRPVPISPTRPCGSAHTLEALRSIVRQRRMRRQHLRLSVAMRSAADDDNGALLASDDAILAFLTATTANTLRDLAAEIARVLLGTSRPRSRGRRECRAPDAPAAVRAWCGKCAR